MNEQNDIHPIEQGLRELEELERAGVFDRASSGTQTAMGGLRSVGHASPRSTPVLLRLGWHWMPIAAGLALAFGVWGWMFSRELSGLKTQRVGAGVDLLASADPVTHFPLTCLTGPDETISEPCRSLDLDSDNRITMADFRHFQLGLANSSQ